jgi:hypothetical protein
VPQEPTPAATPRTLAVAEIMGRPDKPGDDDQ